MNEEIISVVNIAKATNKRRQSIFKIIKKLQIDTIKETNEGSRGQQIAFVSKVDECRILKYIEERNTNDDSNIENESRIVNENQEGLFYLIQLEPEHDPL